jgi:hypothetical protein
MDQQTEAEAKVLVELFEHAGWGVLTRQLKARVEAFQSGCPFNINDEKQLYFMKGAIQSLNEIVMLPEAVIASLEQEPEPPSDT